MIKQRAGLNLKHGVTIATPVFDGAREEDIAEMLQRAERNSSGQVQLIDGRTACFDREVTVGYIYMPQAPSLGRR